MRSDIPFSYDYPLPTSDWDSFVQLIAADAGLTLQQARKHLADAELRGWIERVTSADGSIVLRLTIPEHAR